MGGSTRTETTKGLTQQGLDQLLEKAANSEVDVIHIEPGQLLVAVRFRRNGLLTAAGKLPKQHAYELAQTIKQRARLKTRQTAAPQSGSFIITIGRHGYKVGVTTLPTLNGEKITLELHARDKVLPSLDQLGLWGPYLKTVRYSLGEPDGFILVSAASWQWRDSVLLALTQSYIGTDVSVAWVASNLPDPLPAQVTALPIRSDFGLSAAQRLQQVSKNQPEVIVLGTLSDRLSALVANKVARKSLILVGLPASNIKHGNLFLQQALEQPQVTQVRLSIGTTPVRRLCVDCRVAYTPSTKELHQLSSISFLRTDHEFSQLRRLEQLAMKSGLGSGLPLSTSPAEVKVLYKSTGCSSCSHSGYNGVMGIFEVAETRDEATDLSLSLDLDGLIKALRGLIDLPSLIKSGVLENH